jgi:3-phenylpropionate/trans-cinnamate dioxygenase ferredoxin reductase subunit
VPHYTYLVVGGGMAGDAAIQGIRQVDPSGSVGLLGAEPYPPYNRPPLSKGLWKGMPLERMWRSTDQYGVDLHLGRTARALDPRRRIVVDDRGTEYTWDRLLIATGGAPKKLPFGGDRIIYLRTFDDYRRLRDLADRGRRFAVLGGGFIGSEIAAALAMNGKEVVMLFPGPGIGSGVFPADLSQFLTAYYRQQGVDVRPGEVAVAAEQGQNGRVTLLTDGGQRVAVDGIVAGIGIVPDVHLAQNAGLVVDNGILVNEHLQASHPQIYAAGDVAAFFNPALGTWLRVEHEDNANTMGQAAGRAMAGSGERYTHLPFFYSDLFDLGYEAVGDLDPRLDVVADWDAPFRKGVLYYLAGGRVRGVLLWNTWGQVDAARQLIAEPGPFRPEDLKGRIPVRS